MLVLNRKIMLTNDQKEDYERLKDEVKGYYKWSNAVTRLEYSALLIITIGFIAFGYSIVLNDSLALTVFLIAAYYFFAVTIARKFVRDYAQKQVSVQKIISFLLYSSIINFDYYFDKKRSDTYRMKQMYFKKAKKSSKELLLIINEKWSVGNFPLTVELKQEVETFKQLLNKRVLAQLDIKNEKQIGEINELFWQLSAFLRLPKLEHFRNINNRLNTLPEVSKQNITIVRLKQQPMIKWVIWATGVTIVSFIIYWVGINAAGVSPDMAFGAATSIWAVGVFAIIPISIKTSQKTS